MTEMLLLPAVSIRLALSHSIFRGKNNETDYFGDRLSLRDSNSHFDIHRLAWVYLGQRLLGNSISPFYQTVLTTQFLVFELLWLSISINSGAYVKLPRL